MLFLLGNLRLCAKEYKGAELRTIGTYKYGRFEAHIKPSAGNGQLCSFFTYYDGGGVTYWNEIDIEILGRYTDDVQFNTITPGEVHHVSHHPVFSNTQTAFHTYGFEWTPDYVAWFIDGAEVRRQTGDHIAELNKSQKIMMNIWLPDYPGWVGEWDPAILPVRAYYDWVSYASYTPGTGNTGTDNNFTHQWTEHFNSWNPYRWAKASHTWQGNNCDFRPENVVYRDGYMILCLTDSEHLGYVDPNPPLFLWARASEGKVTVAFSEELEQTSAEDMDNYIIPQVTIDQALLLEGNRSVELSVSGMDLEDSHKIFVSGISDLASPPNTMNLSAYDIFMPEPIEFPLKINVAGNTYSDFLPDQEWNEGVQYGYVGGSKSQYSPYLPIDGTEDDEVYQNERWGLLSYKTRGPSGRYTITLMMAENYFDAPGRRMFDIFVEREKAISNLDVFAEVGKSTAYNLILEDIFVTDGTVDIHFSASIDNPLLNGLILSYESCPGDIGDVDGDGQINFIDLIAVVNHILGTAPLDECAQNRADANGDTIINILDVIEIVNIILGGDF